MQNLNLETLGWTRFYQQQLTADEVGGVDPVRVVEVQRTGVRVLGRAGEANLPLGGRWFTGDPEGVPTVGDWLLIGADGSILRLLERTSLFKRMAPGGRGEVQLLAANVDVAFLVTSCNEEFNVSRLERYLALAIEAQVEPVIVLTKFDLAAEPEGYLEAARAVRSGVHVELVNATDSTTLGGVRAWCRPGTTVALFGSSGVGKSTLLNSLSGSEQQETGAIREADARGRHTTSHR